MSCVKPKCRNKAEVPMVACWLCNAVYHAKCVDLAPRTADNIREDKGLQFFSFFKYTRLELDNINNDLN
ncbi:hypothetical protein FF38_01252 [Lucilia cuprina]|uniref:PHD-type domain-containing protein n=1 Tax=Lucilia cuprina TaxID=7375 RepID=A0A0L0CGS8_LUCCU|nr:hypothetical protein FF38_01252 [Lucilia cuprina]